MRVEISRNIKCLYGCQNRFKIQVIKEWRDPISKRSKPNWSLFSRKKGMNVYILHSYERLSSVTGSFNGLRNVLVIYFCRRQSDPSCLWIWKSFLNRSVSFVTSTHLSLRVIYLSSCYLIYLITRYISFGLYIQ